ncbi:hypothetical protein FRC04_009245 [Tulasnella sp. 424]|nr:hypothetical protein FRC04_009245 [Tulasnella sp. 424]KAG8976397.1 hypothetical protein FRC05_003640 [Tulasnella sp. 425]
MNVALKDVNIDERGKVIVAGKEESGRTMMEEEESEEASGEEDEEEQSGSSEEESSEEEEEEEVKPKLQFRPVFVPNVAGPPTKKFGIGSRQAQEESYLKMMTI